MCLVQTCNIKFLAILKQLMLWVQLCSKSSIMSQVFFNHVDFFIPFAKDQYSPSVKIGITIGYHLLLQVID